MRLIVKTENKSLISMILLNRCFIVTKYASINNIIINYYILITVILTQNSGFKEVVLAEEKITQMYLLQNFYLLYYLFPKVLFIILFIG